MLLKNLFWFLSIKPVACTREEMQRCREKLPRKMVRGGGEEERRREGGGEEEGHTEVSDISGLNPKP